MQKSWLAKMNQITIYHNPRCSKSRMALEMLQSHHLNPVVIEYLKTPISFEQLVKLSSHFELCDFVRTTETLFKELGLNLSDEQQLLAAVFKYPILMQRPIVTLNAKAIIARPPEKILELISS